MDGIFVCISCSKVKSVREINAGHYYPVSTHDGLRFDEDNCHGECVGCNCFNEGHLIGYRKNLIEKIGEERFSELERKADLYKRDGNKFDREYLIERIAFYHELV